MRTLNADEDLACLLEQSQAGRCQMQLARGAHEQLHVQPIFQGTDGDSGVWSMCTRSAARLKLSSSATR